MGIPSTWVNIARRAAASVHFPAFDLHLDRLLTFSGRAREPRPLPCVLTASVEDCMHRFQHALVSAMRDCRIFVQARKFTPHVTMFYDRTIVDERCVEPIRLPVREFVIVHSRIGTGKPFELLGRWPLLPQRMDSD